MIPIDLPTATQVSATGRLSSHVPSLQNIPIRTELSKCIHRAFIAAPRFSGGLAPTTLIDTFRAGPEGWPSVALQYCHARLSDEQIARCAEVCPGAALMYCSARLSDEQFPRLAERCPDVAMEYCSDRLTRLGARQ